MKTIDEDFRKMTATLVVKLMHMAQPFTLHKFRFMFGVDTDRHLKNTTFI